MEHNNKRIAFAAHYMRYVVLFAGVLALMASAMWVGVALTRHTPGSWWTASFCAIAGIVCLTYFPSALKKNWESRYPYRH